MQQNRRLILSFFMFVFLSSLALHALEEKPMVIVIPSYKNKRWCALNIRTVLDQKYENYRVVYIDDASPDETSEKVKNLVKRHPRTCSFKAISFNDEKSEDIAQSTAKFIEEVNQERAFFTLVTNVNRCGALENLYRGICSAEDDEIIVTVDGDDWFPDKEVLKRLNEIYSSEEIWLTHGRMEEFPSHSIAWCEPIPEEIQESNAYRSFKCPSHLRTFYAWLFKKIALEDLLYEGKFFAMTWDMAMMYPMIEMASERHAFVEVPNYVYNMINPINDNKVNAELQRMLDRYIRSAPPYERLQDRFDEPKKESVINEEVLEASQ